jgi:hypothetical protein
LDFAAVFERAASDAGSRMIAAAKARRRDLAPQPGRRSWASK